MKTLADEIDDDYVYCPDCEYYMQDCNPDTEDWEKPCSDFVIKSID